MDESRERYCLGCRVELSVDENDYCDRCVQNIDGIVMKVIKEPKIRRRTKFRIN